MQERSAVARELRHAAAAASNARRVCADGSFMSPFGANGFTEPPTTYWCQYLLRATHVCCLCLPACGFRFVLAVCAQHIAILADDSLASRAEHVMSTATPLVTFGLCTDVQAAAKPDSTSKDDPTRILRYSEASSLLGAAVDYFNMFGAVSFVLHCGDIIDGRDDEESDLQDLESVLTHFRRLSCSGGACHVVGNHCLKNIPRSKLLACLGLERAYFARPLCTGWRLIVLDTTDLSVHGGWPQDSAEYAAANAYLSAHAGEARMVRWNGGVGAAQLAWLEGQLGEARTSGERVVVASHRTCSGRVPRDTPSLERR